MSRNISLPAGGVQNPVFKAGKIATFHPKKQSGKNFFGSQVEIGDKTIGE